MDYQTVEETEKYRLMASFFQNIDKNKQQYYYQKYLYALNQTQQMRSNASVRFVHTSPDAPAVDVYINNERIFTNISYKNISEYVQFPLGIYDVNIYLAGEETVPIIKQSLSLETNNYYTVGAINEVNNIQLMFWKDDENVPSSETKLRFMNLSPDSSNMDVAVQGGDVVFSNVAFKEVTDYLGLTPMTVDLEVRVAGTKDVLFTLDRIKFRPDIGYTAIVVGFKEKKPSLETIFLVP